MRNVRLLLDLDTESTPITGSLRTAGGIDRSFCGWIELAGLIEDARAGTPVDRPDPTDTRTDPRGQE